MQHLPPRIYSVLQRPLLVLPHHSRLLQIYSVNWRPKLQQQRQLHLLLQACSRNWALHQRSLLRVLQRHPHPHSGCSVVRLHRLPNQQAPLRLPPRHLEAASSGPPPPPPLSRQAPQPLLDTDLVARCLVQVHQLRNPRPIQPLERAHSGADLRRALLVQLLLHNPVWRARLWMRS